MSDGDAERAGAPAVTGAFDEGLIDGLQDVDLAALREAMAEHLAELGATYGDDEPFVACPVPRIVGAVEWRALARGLEQRVRALEAFVADAYGARRCVSEGVLTDAIIDDAEGFEAELRGRWPDASPAIGVAGLDIVRDPAGALLVLEDNLRTPSGLAYAEAVRVAVDRTLPAAVTRPVVGPDAIDALGEALRGAARRPDPVIVVLSDGPANSAWFEHRRIAQRLQVPVVTCDELKRDGPRLLHDDMPVDVVYRRCDEDRLREDDGALTPVAELTLEPWLAGELAVVNAWGTGVADDKLVHAYVEDLVRLFCGEEPLLRSVPTLDLAAPGVLEEVLADLPAHVVKPRHGHGGHGVFLGVAATEGERDGLARLLRAAADGWVAQRLVPLSTSPTIVGADAAIEPRHVDLRPFVLTTPDGPRAMPGGLTRVAFTAGELVVNTAQDGGGKTTWVR